MSANEEQNVNGQEIGVPVVGLLELGETIVLNGEESARFAQARLTPPEPTPALRELMQGRNVPATPPRSILN